MTKIEIGELKVNSAFSISISPLYLLNSFNRTLALAVVAINALWVLASAVILFTNWLPLTTGGWWAVALVADMVAIIAGLQFYASWQASKR